MTSGSVEDTVPDNSVFLSRFIATLSSNKKIDLRATEIFDTIREPVHNKTGTLPQYGSLSELSEDHESGEFVFYKGGFASTFICNKRAETTENSYDYENKLSEKECLIIRSEADRYLPRKSTLVSFVERALGKVRLDSVEELKYPDRFFATDIVQDRQVLESVLKRMCVAKVVVFDITHFEPAVMLLLGIRSVVRRGVTILSLGGVSAVAKTINLPFNIKDTNLVFHPPAPGSKEIASLVRRIERGIINYQSRSYSDLPVFDALRRLLPKERKPIPDKEGALVLCSFNKGYRQQNWENHLFEGLVDEYDRLNQRSGGRNKEGHLGIARSLEIDSPRLVSKVIYEYIRRVQTCIVDLTMLSPNVFFELGIRLACSDKRTVCIIEKSYYELIGLIQNILKGSLWENLFLLESKSKEFTEALTSDIKNTRSSAEQYELPKITKESIDNDAYGVYLSHCRMRKNKHYVENITALNKWIAAKQVASISQLLKIKMYDIEQSIHEDQGIKEGYGQDALKDTESNFIYDFLSENIDPETQYESYSVYSEILESAKLFSRSDEAPIAAGIYKSNNLTGEELKAHRERLLAAWYYLTNRYSQQELTTNPDLFVAIKEVVDNLIPTHLGYLKDYVGREDCLDKNLLDKIEEMDSQLL